MRKKIINFLSPSMVAVIAAATIITLALFVPPYIGMADNGDFGRVTYGNGFHFIEGTKDDQLLYFVKEYGVNEYYNDFGSSIFTSQTFFIKLAAAIDNLFTRDLIFDIRFLGAIQSLMLLGAIFLMVEALTNGSRKPYAYAVAALCVFMLADTAYTAYFNSFYAEGLVQISFIASFASMLLIGLNRFNRYVMLGIFTISGIILTLAKQQNVPLGILMALLCFAYLIYERIALKKQQKKETEVKSEQEQREFSDRSRRFNKAVVSAGAILMAAAIGMLVLIPEEFVNINKYHAMTRGLMQSTDNPEKVAEDLGIDKQYSLLDGSIYFERYPVVDVDSQELIDNFYSKYGYLSIAGYYLSHPSMLVRMLNIAMFNGYAIPPEAMGNYERSAGKEPGEHTSFFSLHSYIKMRLAPKTIGFLALWCLVVLLANLRNPWKLIVYMFGILMGLSQIGISIIGAGDADFAKHIFLYNIVFDSINLCLATDLLRGFFRSREKSREAKRQKREKARQQALEAAQASS